MEHGVEPRDFNSYGARRGNHEVMMRGTFANIRIKNALVPDVEGGVTIHLPTMQQMSIYDAAMRYQEDRTPLVVLAGKEYGTGSSRDWAAKGTFLLGVRAVIAESFERIHRTNLVGMGVLPLEFHTGDGWEELGLTGHETITIEGIEDLQPGQDLTVRALREDGTVDQLPGARAGRFGRRAGLLPPRRHPALRAAQPGGAERAGGGVAAVREVGRRTTTDERRRHMHLPSSVAGRQIQIELQ